LHAGRLLADPGSGWSRHDVRRIALSLPETLVRLPAVDVEELDVLITNAWRCQAPRALVKALDERAGASGKDPAAIKI
jgi:hypothetical protein